MKKLTIAAILMTVVLFSGCIFDPEEEELTDREHIRNLLTSAGEMSMGSLDGQGEPGEGGKDTNYPEYWWREKTAEGSFEILFEGDLNTGICTVSVTRTLYGDFNIDVVHDGICDPSIKPISVQRTRRAIVEKTEHDPDCHGGWELTHITPAEYTLNSGLTQEVFITTMTLYVEDELVWECDSPDTFYAVEDGLPVLEPGLKARFEVEVQHTNPLYDPEFYVYVHGPCPTWPRHFMNDLGLWGDVTEGDGIYTYEWYIEGSSEYWYLAADVIDADTMLDEEEDDYDSSAWRIFARKEN